MQKIIQSYSLAVGASYSFTVPSFVYLVDAECIGRGATGSNPGFSSTGGHGGGGGAMNWDVNIPVVPGDTIDIVEGSNFVTFKVNGTPLVSANNAGDTTPGGGGSSWENGKGTIGNPSSPSFDGGLGGIPSASPTGGGGGGGGAGGFVDVVADGNAPGSDGATPVGPGGGAGGLSGWFDGGGATLGRGGNGGSSSVGQAGTFPGGGGGGGSNGNAGGAGADGAVRFAYTEVHLYRRGSYVLYQTFSKISRGSYNINPTFTGNKRGTYGIDLRVGSIHRGGYQIIQRYRPNKRGSYSLGRAYTGMIHRGRWRIANNNLEGYVLYVGENGPPDFTQPPVAYSATLPFSYVITPPGMGSTDFHIVVRQRNSFGLESQNQKTRIITVDSAGAFVRPPTPAPIGVLAVPTAANTFRVMAAYPTYRLDSYTANKWKVWIKATAIDPLMDTPSNMVDVVGDTIIIPVTGSFPAGTYNVAVALFRTIDSFQSDVGETTVEMPAPPGEPQAVESGFQEEPNP